MGIDLGTYHVIVTFEDGRGFIQRWPTGGRFIGGGTGEFTPLSGKWSAPIYDDDDDVISNILHMYIDGNYSCDCNRRLFAGYAEQDDIDLDNSKCGDSIRIASLVIVRPDGTREDMTEIL